MRVHRYFKCLSHLMILTGLTFLLTLTALRQQSNAWILDAASQSPATNNAFPASVSTASLQIQTAFFVDEQYKTSSASIQIDSEAGSHLAYHYYNAVAEGIPTYGVYLYCATACENEANWTGVSFGEQVNEVQLKLTPTGQPRILYRTRATDEDRNDYFYAACDESCTDPAQWFIIYVVSSRGTAPSEFNDDSLPQHYFALDPQGRPRFVYNDHVTGHLGTFYVYCDIDCNNAANWFETRINQDTGDVAPYRYEKFSYPVLAFTPQGQPRIAADGVSLQDTFYLYYLSCDANCEATASWISTPLYERGSGPNVSYDLAIDALGRPRIAFYQGALLEGQGERLYYTWCNSDCLTVQNWLGTDLGLGQNDGRGPDLILDATGQPRLAYALYNEGGVGYSWCDGTCESPEAIWQHQVVESRADLLAAWPVAYPEPCNGGLWDGLTPSLALDPTGQLRLAFDATFFARCTYIPETGEWRPWDVFHLVWRSVRVIYLSPF
jgi:hypothetical protein